jgi:hypothetical protein
MHKVIGQFMTYGSKCLSERALLSTRVTDPKIRRKVGGQGQIQCVRFISFSKLWKELYIQTTCFCFFIMGDHVEGSASVEK